MLINGVDIDIQNIKENSKDKNEAIRKVRELTGATLKDAVNAVEKNIESENVIPKNENISYGVENIFQKGIEQIKENREEQKDFYNKLNALSGADSFGTKKEIKHLKEMLYENEEVFAIASGIMDGNTWLIACTNKRIVFIDSGMIYGVKHSEVMIDKVNGVSFKNGLMLGEIHIEDGASTRIIKNVQKYSTKPFVDAVHKAMELSKKSNTATVQTNISVADEILKFKQLLDTGIITQEEFERQKDKLLNAW